MSDHDRPAIVIITGRANPTLSPSDQLYHDALERLGADMFVEQWNGDGRAMGTDLARADAVVLRSPWDYHGDLDRFRGWLDEIETAGVRLHNPVSLVRWNVDKRYLREVEQAGIQIPETVFLDAQTDLVDVEEALTALRLSDEDRAVLKPAWGGSGTGVELLTRATAVDVVSRFRAALPDRPLLIQRFLPAIASSGETSMIFIDGMFSHAILKRPAPDEFRTNSLFAPPPPEPVMPPGEWVAIGRHILEILPGDVPPLYARIDGVPDIDGQFLCMEVEVIDPGLALNWTSSAADQLAEATLRRVGRSSRR